MTSINNTYYHRKKKNGLGRVGHKTRNSHQQHPLPATDQQQRNCVLYFPLLPHNYHGENKQIPMTGKQVGVGHASVIYHSQGVSCLSSSPPFNHCIVTEPGHEFMVKGFPFLPQQVTDISLPRSHSILF